MNSLLVGVMGHVDHGKTALVRALTGTDMDRLPEEKARGISIALGFALLRTPQAEIDLIDMPGHERFVRTMVAGATGIEAALLVVSAAEGVRAQTREHLEIAALLGLRHGVVAIAQCDRATPEAAHRAGEEAAALATACGFAATPVVRTSAVTGEGVAALAEALTALAQEAAPRPELGLFQLPVDRVFALPGIGPVVTGTLRRGRLSVGEEVEFLPGHLRARVRSLQTHGRAISAAVPGRRVAVGLRGVELAELRRGMVLATSGAMTLGEWLDARLTLTASAPRLENGAVLRLLTGTMETTARLRLPEGGSLQPTEAGLVQFRCDPPIPALAGDGFILRLPSPARTLGGGVILDARAARRRRGDSSSLPRLRAAADGSWNQATALLLREAGAAGAQPAAMVPRLGHAPARLRAWALAAGAYPLPDGVLLDPAAWDVLVQRLQGALSAFHAAHPLAGGMSPEALRAALPAETPPSALEPLLGAAGAVRDGALIRAKGFDPARAMAGGDREMTQEIEATFRTAGLSPPDVAAIIAGDARREQALRYLLRRGVLVRTTDRVQARTILFHREALDQAKQRIAEGLSGPQGFPAREAGALLGISRKYSIPLLEHLDATRFTRRIGDLRFVNRDP